MLQAHTEANSGQVQENGPDNWLAGVCGPLRWGAGAATPSEDTQNERLDQKKLRLATSMHVWAIFQMSISGPQRKAWCCCYHKQLGKKWTENTFFFFFLLACKNRLGKRARCDVQRAAVD